MFFIPIHTDIDYCPILIHMYQSDRNVFVFLASLAESTRQRAYSLVAQAYTSITAEDFAAFVGYSVEEAVKGKTRRTEPPSNVAIMFILKSVFNNQNSCLVSASLLMNAPKTFTD